MPDTRPSLHPYEMGDERVQVQRRESFPKVTQLARDRAAFWETKFRPLSNIAHPELLKLCSFLFCLSIDKLDR